MPGLILPRGMKVLVTGCRGRSGRASWVNHEEPTMGATHKELSTSDCRIMSYMEI